MNYKFECPHCGQRIAATVADAGSVGTCPNCQNQFMVPEPPPTGRVVRETFTPPPVVPTTPKPDFDPKNLKPGQIIGLLFLAGVVIVGLAISQSDSRR